jgi:predicted unusual protein kinase regulating ubiquinone biosynthesis (AarF/ABC1/UbiB family)
MPDTVPETPAPRPASREDRSNLFGEIRRMARTSGAVGGIAARVAGQRVFGIKTDRTAHAEDLRAILGGLKGPLMKVAQFLSTVPDALPEEYAAELAQLQANAPAMGWSFVRRRMASELGPNWQSRFRSFGQEAAAAASLGQVHRATLPDGTDVACKLQYPDMASTVEADLRQLKLAMALYHRMDSAIQNDQIYAEMVQRLREELDYKREASQMRLYGIMLRGDPGVSVPVPVDEYSTTRLLTMTWLNGRGIADWLKDDPSQDERNRLAEALFRAWYVPFYRFGVIHGDPHLGNYQARVPELGVNLLDFGAIRVFEAKFVRGVIDLYEAVRDNDLDKAHHAYESWGFVDLGREKMEVLNQWAHFLYEPLMQDRVRRIQENDDPQYGRAIAEQVHAGLKRTGGVRPPREFVLMDRSAIGLGSVFLRLRAELNWSRMFHELIADFDTQTLRSRQAAALAEAGVPVAK